jgi:hypothetical protein
MASLHRRRGVTAQQVSTLLVLLVLLCSCIVVVEGGKKNKPSATDEVRGDVPSVHYLVEMIGKEMYAYVNRPKYKFYIYMSVGKLPDEQSTIVLLSTVCNVLYGVTIFAGFMLMPRNQLLVLTFFTVFVGPAIILMLLATAAVSLAAFAIYPVYSVVALWLWFFLTSQVAQSLGRHWGLDADRDGDVDFLDFLQYFAHTQIGQRLGLQGLHDRLNDATMDPFQVIHQRLDQLKLHMERASERRLESSPEPSPRSKEHAS